MKHIPIYISPKQKKDVLLTNFVVLLLFCPHWGSHRLCNGSSCIWFYPNAVH